MAKKSVWWKSLLAILAIAGGANWLLVGAFGFDLVQAITMGIEWLQRSVYVLAGVGGIWAGIHHWARLR